MLYLNDILEHRDSRIKARVLHVNYAQDEIWLYNLSDHDAVPKRCCLQQVEANLATGALTLLAGIVGDQVLSPSEASIRKRDAAYERIKPLISTQDILIPDIRSALVKARAAELKCSPQTLYRDLRNWWRNGQTINALLPRFFKRGSTGGTTAQRGRPAKYQARSNYQIQEADRELLKNAVEKLFLKNEVMTLRGCYQRLLEAHYSVLDGEGHRYLKAEGEYPSEQQFRYFVMKTFPREVVLRKRKGNATFELEHRPKLGSLQHQTYTVGDAYEIDATIADVFLVSRRNRAVIIGKPSLYLIYDRKSGLIVGFYVGLEPSSWPAAMQAIKSISEDKEALCRRYGVTYDPEDWPAHGVFPKQFIADRGELLSDNSTQLADGLDIAVLNLPSRRADHKPLVECGFKLQQRSMADAVPGYAPPEQWGKRQSKKYDKDAALTLDEFAKIILEGIIRANRTPRQDYLWPAEYVLQGIQPIPLNIWNIEIRQRAGALARIPEEQILFALLPRSQATVTREGIRLGACYYACPEAMSRGWMVAAGRGAFQVKVSYDRRLVDTIFIHDDQDSTKFFVATLLDRCSDYRGLSFREVEAIEYRREMLRQEGRQIARQNQLEFHAQIDPVAKQAKAEMKEVAKGRSRTSRKKDIVEDRANELRERRQTEARIPRTPAPAPTTAQVIPLVTQPAEPPAAVAAADAQPKEIATQTPMADRDARRRQLYKDMLDGK